VNAAEADEDYEEDQAERRRRRLAVPTRFTFCSEGPRLPSPAQLCTACSLEWTG